METQTIILFMLIPLSAMIGFYVGKQTRRMAQESERNKAFQKQLDDSFSRYIELVRGYRELQQKYIDLEKKDKELKDRIAKLNDKN